LTFLRWVDGDERVTLPRCRGVHLRSDLTLTLQPSTASADCGVEPGAEKPRRAARSAWHPPCATSRR